MYSLEWLVVVALWGIITGASLAAMYYEALLEREILKVKVELRTVEQRYEKDNGWHV